jgi:hypothetical protein
MIFTLLALQVQAQVHAATLNLNAGDTATINANTPTTVTCGTADDCSAKISSFNQIMTACMTDYDGGTCVGKYWPSFKQNNPNCYDGAVGTCLTDCETTYSAGQCASTCN